MISISGLFQFKTFRGQKLWSRYKTTVPMSLDGPIVDPGTVLLCHRADGMIWLPEDADPKAVGSLGDLIESGVLIPVWKSMPKVPPKPLAAGILVSSARSRAVDVSASEAS